MFISSPDDRLKARADFNVDSQCNEEDLGIMLRARVTPRGTTTHRETVRWT